MPRALLLAIGIGVLAAACAPAPETTPELAWGAYSFPRDPRYQLIFEGTTDGREVSEVRIFDEAGKLVGSVGATSTADQTLRLCGGTKSGNGIVGPSRATMIVTEQQWNNAVRRPDALRAEVRIGGNWRPASLKHICAAQVD